MKILSAGNNEIFDFATPIGVGLIESSINLTKLILEEKPKSLLFIGTAGSYGNFKPFDVVYSYNATNIETGFFSNTCYTPIDNKVTVERLNVSCETTNNNYALVNSSNYITTNKQISKEFLKLDMELENMEFYTILTIAKKFNLPALGLFVVTNYCDEFAHDNFKINHKKAKELLTLHVNKIMSKNE